MWGDRQFYPSWTSILHLECPKMVQILKYAEKDCQHRISHIKYHIWPILLVTVIICDEMGNFSPFWPPIWSLVCPQIGQIFKYGENDCHHQISHMKHNIWSIFLVTFIIYEEMGDFAPFWPIFYPLGYPKMGQIFKYGENNYHYQFPQVE